MASSVYQISWFSNDGKRIGVWRTTSKPIYSPDYPDWCQFTRMDTQKMVTLSFGIVAVEEVEATAPLPVEAAGLQVHLG
jgi:hypothetical protein